MLSCQNLLEGQLDVPHFSLPCCVVRPILASVREMLVLNAK